MRLENQDGEDEDTDGEDDSEPESRYAEPEHDDFPPEEEDEDNPDWYRVADPGDVAEDLVPQDGYEVEDDEDWDDDHVDDGPPELVEPTTPRPSNVVAFYDADGYYAYVLARRTPIPFGEQEAAHLQKALHAAGIEVSKSAASFQPASDGVQYDWYLRVRTRSGEKPPSSTVQRTLASFVGPDARPNTDARVLQLERSLAQAREALADAEERVEAVQREVESARTAERRAHGTIEEIRAHSERARLRAIETEALLVERLASAVAVRRSEVDDDLESLISHLKGALNEQRSLAQELKLAAERKAKELEEYVAVFDAENRRLTAALDEARADVGRLRSSLAAPNRAIDPSSSKASLKRLVEALLPHVRFHGPSFDILHKELQDPIPALSLLGEIQASGAHRKEKAVVSAQPWRRVRFRTGTSDDGRLYFARNRTTAHLEVIVSRKGQQQEDIAFLRTIPLS